MAEQPRHHHYIPQAYLRGFAQKRGTRQWLTHVTDLTEGRSYPTNIRNVCGERDFMRIDVEGHEPDIVEKELAGFETTCVEAIRRVAESSTFQGEDANLTLNLMALLAVRSPEMRENLRAFRERAAKRLMDFTLATEERWEGAKASANSNLASRDVSYEQVKCFHESGQYKVTLRREHQIGNEFQMMSTVLEELGKRRWTVYTTDGTYGEFITTNRPVTLSFVDPEDVPPFYRRSPGFSLAGTEVHFPLTRRAMLVGRWDRGGHAQVAKQTFIAAVNTHMAGHCFGRLFSRQKAFLYFDRYGKVCLDGNLIERAKG